MISAQSMPLSSDMEQNQSRESWEERRGLPQSKLRVQPVQTKSSRSLSCITIIHLDFIPVFSHHAHFQRLQKIKVVGRPASSHRHPRRVTLVPSPVARGRPGMGGRLAKTNCRQMLHPPCCCLPAHPIPWQEKGLPVQSTARIPQIHWEEAQTKSRFPVLKTASAGGTEGPVKTVRNGGYAEMKSKWITLFRVGGGGHLFGFFYLLR